MHGAKRPAYLGRQRDRRDRRPGYLATGTRGRGRGIGINHHQPGGDAFTPLSYPRPYLHLTGDCPCGRTHKRLARFKGRSDDMIILKGVNLFPIQIEKILMQFKELGSNYLITLETIGNSDEMLIEVELSDLFTDDYSALQRLTKGITRQLKDELLLTPRIKLVAKGSLPTTDGKAVRVKDHRKLC